MTDDVNIPHGVIRQFEREYILACFLYYHGPFDIESPLADREFDQHQGFLQYWWDHTSPEFKARTHKGTLKTDAHSLVFSDAEKIDAIAWAQHEGKGEGP